ncbi:hypothetical protein XW81_01880 [Buchnera aphidicola (Schlechtendalia chinensis)]|uniref:5-formyltetrahydrofolate cyclo-ligase n=1 Tax=Buchnera aphidicola subsp. Schlechtendalia chinensis TaxID=118110 RepID=A0A172WDT0_BUCSC|nr:5-formyltetrahydrofolate cyclo-ligase [Buchnera aphidicola]ANF17138.1 hypothetical protein XW81_01880 [Buchnera aphidicola (Schlechtendalia chinensis)]
MELQYMINKSRYFQRQYFRNMRKKLNIEDRKEFSDRASDIAFNCNELLSSKNVAIFMSFDGEIDTSPLILKLWRKNYNVFLPIIHSYLEKILMFVPYFPDTIVKFNKFNIIEPEIDKKKDVLFSKKDMDVIIVPLVAFNKNGYRLGMGGGFYDRILKNWKKEEFVPIGLAYSFQLSNEIIPSYWEVPLLKIVTPDKLWSWNINRA